MNYLTRTLFCGALLLSVAACRQVKVTPIAPATPRPAVLTDSVRLFFSPEAVPFRYDEIALLSMNVDWNLEDKEDIYLALRKKAGELGANGVIVALAAGQRRGENVGSVVITSGGLRGDALAVFLHLADTVVKR